MQTLLHYTTTRISVRVSELVQCHTLQFVLHFTTKFSSCGIVSLPRLLEESINRYIKTYYYIRAYEKDWSETLPPTRHPKDAYVIFHCRFVFFTYSFLCLLACLLCMYFFSDLCYWFQINKHIFYLYTHCLSNMNVE